MSRPKNASASKPRRFKRHRCPVCNRLFNTNNWVSLRVYIRLLVWKPKVCGIDCAIKELRRLKRDLKDNPFN